MPLILWIFQTFIKRLNNKMVGDYAAIDVREGLSQAPSNTVIFCRRSAYPRSLRFKVSVLIYVLLLLYLSGVNSFVDSGYFYSASSSPLLLRGAPDTARIMCRSFTPKRHRQLRVKDLSKAPTRRLERDSTLRTKGDESTNEPPRPTISLF